MKKEQLKYCLNKIQFSHIMCIFCGALIPIYADTLFLHGFDSSTVSAIMDTIMAIAATYASYSVRNWLKDRVKNKGFEHAEKILSDLHSAYVLFFTLKELSIEFGTKYMSGSTLDNDSKNKLNRDLNQLETLNEKCLTKNLDIISGLDTLKAWDMSCNCSKQYLEYIRRVEICRKHITTLIEKVDDVSIMAQHKKWIDLEPEIKNTYNNSKRCFIKLEKRFHDAFDYTPLKNDAK